MNMSRLILENKKVQIFYPLLLLLIPLIGMFITDEIKWSQFDFIIMGGLLLILGIGISLIRKKIKFSKTRILYIGILVFVFLLIWAELAVGIYGTPFAGD